MVSGIVKSDMSYGSPRMGAGEDEQVMFVQGEGIARGARDIASLVAWPMDSSRQPQLQGQ